MTKYIINAIYIFLFVAPNVYMCIYPFKNKLKIKQLYVLLLFVSLILINFIIDCALINMSENGIVETIYRYIWGLIYFFITCVVIDERLSKPIFLWFSIQIFYGVSIGGLYQVMLESNLSVLNFEINYRRTGIFILALSMILLLTIYNFIEKYLTLVLDEVENEVWDNLSIILAIILVMGILYLYGSDIGHRKNIVYLFMSLVICASIFATVMILMNSLNKNKKNIQLQNKLESMDKILEIQQEQYLALSKRVTESRQIRHNKRHHLNAIHSYVNKNDKDGLFDYIKIYMEEIPRHDVIYCKNNTINIILEHYMRIAKSHNIETDVKVRLPIEEETKLENIKNTDLWVLLGNILENAIEACNRVDESKKFISIGMRMINDMLIITVDNNFDGIIRKYKDECFYSSKENDRIGIGVESIKVIVNKYDGIYKFEYDDNMFCTSIMLRIDFSTK